MDDLYGASPYDNAYNDVVAINEVIRGSDRAWTIARVPILNNGETREYQLGYIGDGQRTTTLTRIGFASFVIDELQKNECIHKAPLVTLPN